MLLSAHLCLSVLLPPPVHPSMALTEAAVYCVSGPERRLQQVARAAAASVLVQLRLCRSGSEGGLAIGTSLSGQHIGSSNSIIVSGIVHQHLMGCALALGGAGASTGAAPINTAGEAKAAATGAGAYGAPGAFARSHDASFVSMFRGAAHRHHACSAGLTLPCWITTYLSPLLCQRAGAGCCGLFQQPQRGGAGALPS